MRKTYRSDALAAIHETAADLHDAGVTDKPTLAPVRRAGADGRSRPEAVRTGESESARPCWLSERDRLISQWERGEHPAGASLKLLSLVERGGLDATA